MSQQPPAPTHGAPPHSAPPTGAPSHGYGAAPAPNSLDISERGAPVNGKPQVSDRRLFMQLQAYTDCTRPADVAAALHASGLDAVLYLDVNDPRGIGVLFMAEDPAVLAGPVRDVQASEAFRSLVHKPELTMIGRTYSFGREPDLVHWLVNRPRITATNPAWPWAVWYPLRRKPEFAVQPMDDQRAMLREHADIGMQFGDADFAHDVRLACHGLDENDNDFVIGLIGKELFPLSRCVQEMRKTRQTAQWMQSLGPFFVGKAFWQSPAR